MAMMAEASRTIRRRPTSDRRTLWSRIELGVRGAQRVGHLEDVRVALGEGALRIGALNCLLKRKAHGFGLGPAACKILQLRGQGGDVRIANIEGHGIFLHEYTNMRQWICGFGGRTQDPRSEKADTGAILKKLA